MLKGISPLLTPDLLHLLASMGHGDEVAIVDANFPAATHAKRLLRLPGCSAPDLLQAVLSLLPLDDFVESPAHSMQVVGDASARPEVVRAFDQLLAAHGAPATTPLERSAFYQRACGASGILVSGELRLYGNILLRKGVLRP